MERNEPVSTGHASDLMTTVIQPNLMDLMILCNKPRRDDVEQYIELTGEEWDVDKVATDLYTRTGFKFVLLDNNAAPIVGMGMDPVIPGVWQTWMVGSYEAWAKHWKAITKDCRKIINTLIQEEGVRRIQTMALASRVDTCKWYEKALRMELESVAKGFGITGQDVACYVRLRE